MAASDAVDGATGSGTGSGAGIGSGEGASSGVGMCSGSEEDGGEDGGREDGGGEGGGRRGGRECWISLEMGVVSSKGVGWVRTAVAAWIRDSFLDVHTDSTHVIYHQQQQQPCPPH